MEDDIKLRQPNIDDGAEIWRVVKESGTLDLNSAYLYLLLCKDFADTCVVAERDGRICGFVTGYRPPGRDDVIFLWQVGVDADARGRGLAKRMLASFLKGAPGARYLETTISPSNAASQALFRGVARDLGTECAVSACFRAAQFPGGGHEDEELYRIGPFDPARTDRLSS